MDRVLVTGATGAVGPQVVAALRDAGYRIRTFAIDHPRNYDDPGDEIIVGNVIDPEMVARAVHGADFIVHLASLLHINNPRSSLYREYERVNVDGTRNIVNSAIRENVRKIIFFSTIAVYGDTAGRIVTEHSPLNPLTYYAKTKMHAEKIVLNARSAAEIPLGTVLRFGAIYGSRMKGNYMRLLKSLKNGIFIPVGDGMNRRTLIYDKDAANAVVTCIQESSAAGKVYNVSDGAFHTLKEIMSEMCKALDKSVPRISLPIGPIKSALSMLDNIAGLLSVKLPFNKNLIDKFTEDIAVDSTAIRNELDFRARYDLARGLEDAVAEMKKNGTL